MISYCHKKQKRKPLDNQKTQLEGIATPVFNYVLSGTPHPQSIDPIMKLWVET
jgi:hypothetical protein